MQYELNPSKIPEFEEYARAWIPLVEKFGGTHHGYYLPHEGPNDLAVCLFSFPSLADYEAYRTKSLTDSECRQAYQFAEDRYGTGSTLITSQLPLSTWHEVIGEPTFADAILDRLVHNAYRLELNGQSFRKKDAQAGDETGRT